MSEIEKDAQDDLVAEDQAHKYFMHPEKPGVLVCVPVADMDTSGMYCYFAQFLPEDDKPDTWNVMFPDLPGCLTCGNGLKQAMANAIDALGGYISIAKSEGLEIAGPSDMAIAIAKARKETLDAGIKSSHPPLYLLVPAWPDI